MRRRPEDSHSSLRFSRTGLGRQRLYSSVSGGDGWWAGGLVLDDWNLWKRRSWTVGRKATIVKMVLVYCSWGVAGCW